MGSYRKGPNAHFALLLGRISPQIHALQASALLLHFIGGSDSGAGSCKKSRCFSDFSDDGTCFPRRQSMVNTTRTQLTWVILGLSWKIRRGEWISSITDLPACLLYNPRRVVPRWAFWFRIFVQTFHANVRVSSAMYTSRRVYVHMYIYARVCMSIWGSGWFYSRIVCNCGYVPGYQSAVLRRHFLCRRLYRRYRIYVHVHWFAGPSDLSA